MNRRRSIPELTDEEEAAIQAGISADPENPEWTADDFAHAKPFAEMFPDWARNVEEGRLGGIEFVGVDSKIVLKLQQEGPDWQRRVNDILRKAVGL